MDTAPHTIIVMKGHQKDKEVLVEDGKIELLQKMGITNGAASSGKRG